MRRALFAASWCAFMGALAYACASTMPPEPPFVEVVAADAAYRR